MKRSAEEALDKPSESFKKANTIPTPPSSHDKDAAADKTHFRPDLFDPSSLSAYTTEYASATPYPHGTIPSLFNQPFLRLVRNEITSSLPFTPKETDIYKMQQSFDLASLSTSTHSSLLPNLLSLRAALYSPAFRDYLCSVAGITSGLSGSKTDMAINIFTPGCHLLCHDDVIGSRRLSYILYLTDPDEPWRAEWGGALRLFGTELRTSSTSGKKVRVALPAVQRSIPPVFGQLAFFEVLPGRSFHDVEEVRPGEGEEGERVRMAISGWFHAPQKGEEGFDPDGQTTEGGSSLEQLGGADEEFDRPRADVRLYRQDDEATTTTTSTAKGKEKEKEKEGGEDEAPPPLSEADLDFLLGFLSPHYLVPDAVRHLSGIFEDECALALSHVLNPAFATKLHAHLSTLERTSPGDMTGWSQAAPPHKHSFRYLQLSPPPPPSSAEGGETGDKTDPLCSLLNTLLPSPPFRRWLQEITGLTLRSYDVLARRFPRGEGYALAMGIPAASGEEEGEEEEAGRLEVRFGVSPGFKREEEEEVGEENKDPDGVTQRRRPRNGTEVKEMMAAPPEDEEREGDSASDPEEASTIHPSPDSQPSPSPSRSNADEDEDEEEDLVHGGYESYLAPPDDRDGEEDAAVYKSKKDGEEDEYEDDGGVLFQSAAAWDGLSIVLRDAGVLRFVKFVESAARGDRWDVGGSWGLEGDGEGE